MIDTTQTYITAAEFFAMTFDDEQQRELVNGEIILMPPSRPINTIIAIRLATALFNFLEAQALGGFVTGPDGGFQLAPNTVRMPDVAYISHQRAPNIPERFEIAPDLAVEVISPSETAQMVIAKTQAYLDAGVQQVWNVYPDIQRVEIWTASDETYQMAALERDATLTGGDLLPGFEIALARLFAAKPAS